MTSRTLAEEVGSIIIDVTFVNGMLQAMKRRLKEADMTTLSVEMFATNLELQTAILDLVLDRLDNLVEEKK